MAITMQHREDENTANVSCFLLCLTPPPQSIYIFASWNIFTASFLGPPVWSSISLEGNFHPPNNESKKLKVSALPPRTTNKSTINLDK